MGILLLVGVAACQPIQPGRFGRTGAGAYHDVTNVDDAGSTTVNRANLAAALASMPTGALSAEERDGLLWMREEEKLAHDVYVTLYEKHPATGNAVGVFVNPTLQGLYDQLVAHGSQSLAGALMAGATIEDLPPPQMRTTRCRMVHLGHLTSSETIALTRAKLVKAMVFQGRA